MKTEGGFVGDSGHSWKPGKKKVLKSKSGGGKRETISERSAKGWGGGKFNLRGKERTRQEGGLEGQQLTGIKVTRPYGNTRGCSGLFNEEKTTNNL